MPAEMISFSFESSSSSVRVIEVNGDPWWVAKDVAEALEYAESTLSNMSDTIKHVPDEWKGRVPIPTLGGIQELLCLSEAGLFFFVNRSDKPKALPFQLWVNGEVLPAIRKRGFYGEMKLNDRVRYHALLARIIKQIEDSDCAYSHRILIQQIQDICALLRIQPPPVSSLSKIAPQLTLAEV